MANWGAEQSWGPGGCYAEQRETHLPSTLFSSTCARQEKHLQNAAGGRPQQWVCLAPCCAEMSEFWGDLWDQDKAGISWDAAVWFLSKNLGSAPPKYITDILNPGTGWQPVTWAAHERVGELTRILRHLSSSRLFCDPCFSAFPREADPTALFTPFGCLLLLGSLNPSVSLKNSSFQQCQILLSQNRTGSG